MKKVKRPAKIGEYILITNKDHNEERYNNGDIFKVTDCATNCYYGDVYVNDIDDPWFVFYKEYVVLEDYLERDDTIKEGMINMNKVLKLYLDKHSEEIVDKYDNLVEKEYNALEIVKEYKALINEFEINLQSLFDREENQINNVFERVVTQNVYKYDLDESKLKYKIAMKYRDAKEEEYNELNKLVEEVEAQLSLSDDLEYQLDVLKRYDIINKKTKKVN